MELSAKICQLEKNEFFSSLPAETQAVLKDDSPSMIFRKSQFIARQGEQTSQLYFLCQGRAVQTRVNPYGKSTIVSIITENMFLGTSSLLLNGKFPFSFKAIEDCCVHALEKTRFLSAFDADSVFRRKILEQLCLEEIRVKEELSNCRGLQGRQNVASLLQLLANKFGRPGSGGVELDISLSRSDLAEMCGMSTEALVRILSSLRNEGIIRNIVGKRLVISDPAALSRVTKKN